MARQVRGQLIALKEQEFSMAALVIGASDARILFRHLLINAIGPIIVQITFLVPNAIFTEAFLSFIGPCTRDSCFCRPSASVSPFSP